MKNFLSCIVFGCGTQVKEDAPTPWPIGRAFLILAGGLWLVLWDGSFAYAQEQKIAQETTGQKAGDEAQKQPLRPKDVERLEQMQADITVQKEDLAQLENQISATQGLYAEVVSLRRDRLWTVMFNSTLKLAREVSNQKTRGRDVSAYQDLIFTDLRVLPGEAYGAMARLRAKIAYPSPDLETEKFVFADKKLAVQMHEMDEIYAAFIAYIEIADQFGLDATDDREYMVKTVTEDAANRSAFLEMAEADARLLRSSTATLPDDKELADLLRAVQARVQLTARAMSEIVALMGSLDIESRQYRKQLLTVTGEITTDILDFGIVVNLLSEWASAIGSAVTTKGPKLLIQLFLMTLIIFGFTQLARVVTRLVRRGLDAAHVRISYLLKEMILMSVRNLVVVVGILIALSQIGVSLGPLLAGIGIIGFIIGFALQDSLANFASGMLILLYRPFDVGDIVEANGVEGKVSHMSLVNTTLKTLDNRRLIVPNNLIWSSVITNLTAQRTRRIDLVFGISYEDDLEKAEKVLQSIVGEHEAVLNEPEPLVRVMELGESSVNFAVRPWVKTADYWETYWDLTKKVKLRFDEEGISIPYPQHDLHIKEQKPA